MMRRLLYSIGIASLALSMTTAANALSIVAGEITITKTGPDTVQVGDMFEYAIKVHNGTATDAENVRIGDNLPAELEYISGTPNCSDAGTIWCEVGTLKAGEHHMVTLKVKVRDHTPCNTHISNTADVHTDNAGSNWATETTKAMCHSTGELTIVKEGPSVVKVGEMFEYTLKVHNGTTTEAHNVRVGDNLPGELEYISGTPNCSDAGTIWCNLGTLAPGAHQMVTLKVRVRDHSACDIDISNTGDVHTDNVGSNWSTHNTRIECNHGNINDVHISKTDNRNEVDADGTADYEIEVHNAGSKPVTITVRDSFPSGTDLTHVGEGGQNNAGEAIWENLTLAAGERKTLHASIYVHGNLGDGHVLRNTASIDGGKSATDETTVRSRGNPGDIHIEVLDNPDPIEPDERLNYNIRVTNQGSATIRDATVTQTLPSEIRFISATDSGNHAGGVITWTDIDIDGFSTRNFHVAGDLTGSVRDGDILRTFVNAGSATHEEHTTVFDPFDDRHHRNDDRHRNRDRRDRDTRRCVGLFELYATDSHDPVRIGDIFEYQIEVHNACHTSSTIDVIAHMDEASEFVSASDNGRKATASHQVTWRRLFLEPGETRPLFFSVQVRDRAQRSLRMQVRAGTHEVTETTTIEGGTSVNNPPIVYNPPVVRTTPLPPFNFRNRITPGVDIGFEGVFDGNDRGLKVTKMSDKEEARPGDQVFYTIIVENTTGEDLQNVFIEDVFEETPYGRIIDPGTGTPDINNVVRWFIDYFPNGDSRTYRYTVRVSDDAPHMAEITNDVYVEAESAGSNGGSRCTAGQGERCVLEGTTCLVKTGVRYLRGEVPCSSGGFSSGFSGRFSTSSSENSRHISVERSSSSRTVNGVTTVTETETTTVTINGRVVGTTVIERVNGRVVNEYVTGNPNAEVTTNTTVSTVNGVNTGVTGSAGGNFYSVGYWHMIHIIRNLPQTGVMAALLTPTDSPFLRPYAKSANSMNPALPVGGTLFAGALVGGIMVVRRKFV